LLWLNGGPGCSSLIGMSYENGPFKFKPNSTEMIANPHSWNRKANLLYIESPAGVGFSVGPTANVSDETVQEQNLQAMVTFFAKFPSLRSNEFYISGESYAGIYVPYLALAIHQYNTMSTTSLPINFKGLIVGNACTDPSECYQPGPNGTSLHQYEFLYKHGFYTDLEYDRMRAACVMGYDGSICKRIRQEMDEFFDKTKTPILNIYATCYGVGKSP
jgi:carboxypeptidase C (cathepsin A)